MKYAVRNGTFKKKQQLFFVAGQQCREFATYADVQYTANAFFHVVTAFFFFVRA